MNWAQSMGVMFMFLTLIPAQLAPIQMGIWAIGVGLLMFGVKS